MVLLLWEFTLYSTLQKKEMHKGILGILIHVFEIKSFQLHF